MHRVFHLFYVQYLDLVFQQSLLPLSLPSQTSPFWSQQPTEPQSSHRFWKYKVSLIWLSKWLLRALKHTFPWAEHFWGPFFTPYSASNTLLSGREDRGLGPCASLGNTTLPLCCPLLPLGAWPLLAVWESQKFLSALRKSTVPTLGLGTCSWLTAHFENSASMLCITHY